MALGSCTKDDLAQSVVDLAFAQFLHAFVRHLAKEDIRYGVAFCFLTQNHNFLPAILHLDLTMMWLGKRRPIQHH